MKKYIITLLLLFALTLCGCSGQGNGINAPAAQDEQQSPEVTAPAEPIYGYEEVTRERNFTDESTGEVYAGYKYSVPMLGLVNADELSEETLALAQRNVEVFNAQMQKILDEAVAYGEELAFEAEGAPFGLALADEKILSVSCTGQIMTVLEDGYFYGGGAHPYTYSVSYTFDLTLGQFIDPAQIGDDPEAFRTKAAALLVAKAEGLGEDYTAGYWDDYADIISRWNEAAVLFDARGMTVIFSVYELGPYAMGPVELFLTYEELAEAIGEGGLAHLGVA